MNIWKNTVITDKGAELQLKLLKGQGIKITKVKTGAGQVPLVNLRKQTEVLDIRQEIHVCPAMIKDDQITILVFLENEEVSESYDLWQVGFYAEDPDEGEILYCVSQAEKEKHIPAGKESPGFSITWEFCFKTSDSAPFEVAVDPAGLVSIEEYKVHSEQINSLTDKLGDIGSLATNEKNNLTGAVNEIKSEIQKIDQNVQTMEIDHIAINNSEDAGRNRKAGLFFMQNSGTANNPSDGWHSKLRLQHPGYENGYWQEIACNFSSDAVYYRRNNNGQKSAFKRFVMAGDTEVNDTGWVNCSLGYGIAQYGAAPAAQVRRIGKIVHLRGCVKNTTTWTEHNSIITIPDGYRPSYQETFVMQGSGSNRFTLIVNQNGVCYAQRYSNNTTMSNTVGVGSWLNLYATWFMN